ncbi:TetR/AcrR family transcriptional regulator [Bacillus kwashiorkori]|uniref:TetR/AcrR family transcriptional regulator n=1 Tax=Bacillus kwashiorkori TaxID=1522318 RepID=UPI000781372B|nr:TetR/AcrR family transcriptional regulator [Bacillus kwashiorkori]
MPKPTFFNLPEEKKQLLLKEAVKEFSRASLPEASIANIVKAAGIARGSFYQYFEDKEDLYFYILSDFIQSKRKAFITILEKNNGNLFSTFFHFFEEFIRDKENYHFYQNALLNMSYKIEKKFEAMISVKELNEDFIVLSSMIDMSNLKVTDHKELFHAIQLMVSITIRNFIQVFAREVSYEEAVNNFRIEMKLLMTGLLKDVNV